MLAASGSLGLGPAPRGSPAKSLEISQNKLHHGTWKGTDGSGNGRNPFSGSMFLFERLALAGGQGIGGRGRRRGSCTYDTRYIYIYIYVCTDLVIA